MAVAADTRLTHYRILSPLGSGGGGEVYRARDLRLHRDVALKIISARTADAETIRRFEAEAQNVAALNHPNIVTVYEAGRDGENLFIATELVDGQSLRQLLEESRTLPLNRLLDLGLQIAEGLAAAHDEGIVHRDLKPENVMITRAGRVKIVDFGIAKVVESDAWSALRTLGNNDTAPGLLLGTTAYMSPEQARGGRASYPTDQFALGLILYEMATGEAPFRRESPLATLSAVLTEDVPEVPTGSPAFRWLVKRLLHKEPDHRYGSMHDVVRELQSIRMRLTDPAGTVPSQTLRIASLPTAKRSLLPVAALSLVCLLAGFVLGSGSRTKTDATTPVYTPLISSEGLQLFPAFASDGRLMAWSGEDGAGVLQIFIGTRGSDARPLQLTWGQDDALFPFWSPDGSRTYFVSGEALWSVSATGGEPQRLLSNVLNACVAPDGRTFAILRTIMPGGGLAHVEVGPLDKLRKVGKPVLTPGWLRFSMDGRMLGAWITRTDGVAEFLTVDPATLQVTPRLPAIRVPGPAREFCWWTQAGEIVFADRSAGSSGPHLYVANLGSGDIRVLTSGTGAERFPATDGRRRQLAFSSAQADYDVIRISFKGEREELSATSRFELAPILSANQLTWVSDRSGTPEVLLRSLADGQERSLFGPDSFGEDRTSAIGDIAVTPDGKRLAFWRAGSDDEAIWIAPLTGGAPVRLGKEDGDAIQRGPSWSPDGQDLVYFSVRDGEYVLMRARPGSSGSSQIIARNAGTYPRWSPTGTHIATLAPEAGAYLISVDGAGRKRIGNGKWLLHGWSQDGNLLYGVRRAGSTLELVHVDVETGAERTVTSLGDHPAEFSVGAAIGMPAFHGWSLSPNGTGFVSSVLGMDADLWLLER